MSSPSRKSALSGPRSRDAEVERRVMERTRALNDRMEELARANAELALFASIASHELHEPLRKICTFGELIKTRCAAGLTPEAVDYLERMQRASAQLESLVDALLGLARITSKGSTLGRVPLDAVVRDVVAELEGAISAAGAKVRIGKLPTLKADAQQMRQLFYNLIGNALKFRRRQGPALVSVSAEEARDGFVRILVEDNGIGFDEKHRDLIFQPFQRLHGRGEYDGSGMGLALCSRIMMRHGGAITAASVPGAGSTFVVTLPSAERAIDSRRA